MFLPSNNESITMILRVYRRVRISITGHTATRLYYPSSPHDLCRVSLILRLRHYHSETRTTDQMKIRNIRENHFPEIIISNLSELGMFILPPFHLSLPDRRPGAINLTSAIRILH